MLDPWGTPYQYYRINCTADVEITTLARLKLRKKRPPRLLLATHSLPTMACTSPLPSIMETIETFCTLCKVRAVEAVAHPVAVLGEREKTGFSSR
jgi:hypothetical protein